MRRSVFLAMMIALAASSARAEQIVVLEVADSIQPASLRYVERGLRHAADHDAVLVVIELDTPGGLLTSLRTMISAILASPVPVAVYVTPPGARAASAGFFLVLAADVAAMAPGTNTGAAHPVSIGQQQEGDEVIGEKATQDAAAMARALAVQRGRSVEWAEEAVVDSRSYSASEALDYRLIDKVVISREILVRELDGAAVTRPDGTRARLALAGAEVVVLERTFAERVLSVIADPQIAYLLLMLGVLGLFLELMNPGPVRARDRRRAVAAARVLRALDAAGQLDRRAADRRGPRARGGRGVRHQLRRAGGRRRGRVRDRLADARRLPGPRASRSASRSSSRR